MFHYFIILLAAAGFAFLAYYSYKQFRQITRHKNTSPTVLLKDFKRKMIMTIGLGIVFFSFYGILVLFLAYWLNRENGLNLFFLAYQQPLAFLYGGLFIFILFSLLIYLMRMVIKYIYLSRFKD